MGHTVSRTGQHADRGPHVTQSCYTRHKTELSSPPHTQSERLATNCLSHETGRTRMSRNLAPTYMQQKIVCFTHFQHLPIAAKYQKKNNNNKFITNVNDKNTYFLSLTLCIVIYTKFIKNKSHIFML
jgi:hypothetical protein